MYKENELRALLQGKRILIAGHGREGQSTQRLLHTLLPDSHPAVAEGNEAIRQEAAKGYDLIVKSPGIPLAALEGCCDPAAITSQTDLFLQVHADQVVGVTGTKGKSTTASLVHAILRSHYGRHALLAGNIGIPLFDIVPDLDSQSIVVCELSCHQLEGIRRSPRVGVLLNLFQEHLDHYPSYLAYQMAKMNIGLHQHADDYFFYCADNATLRQRVEENQTRLKGHVIPYDLAEARQLQDIHSPLQGDHNLCNILAAYYVALIMQVPKHEIVSAINAFQGLAHRMQRVGTYRGITFYDDSISTIPEACMAAIQALGEVDTLIVGGFDRGIDYTALMDFLAASAVRNLVFVGQAGRRMLTERGGSPAMQGHHIVQEDDYERIVAWCFRHTQPGHICLLSPAAASYDAFKNFEERGDTFSRLVTQMGEGEALAKQ